MSLLRLARPLMLLALLVALARPLANAAGFPFDAATVRDAVGTLVQLVERAIEQVR